MSGSRTALKVISIFMVIISILSILTGILLLAGSNLPELTDSAVGTKIGAVSGTAVVLSFGIITLIAGVIYLII